MQNPFTFRPIATEFQPDPTDWENNAVSNFFAWAANRVTPRWCGSPDHWTSRVTAPLWTSCYCCVAARWFIVGGVVGFIAGAVLA